MTAANALATDWMPQSQAVVVLDTNVFVAAYWAPESASASLVNSYIHGWLEAAYTREVRNEVEHVLRTIKARAEYLRALDPFWQRSREVVAVAAPDVIVDDPDDRKFVEAAAGAEADFLITNDYHLLRIGYVGRTEILTPGSAARVLGLLPATRSGYLR